MSVEWDEERALRALAFTLFGLVTKTTGNKTSMASTSS